MTELKPALERLARVIKGESPYTAYRGEPPAGTPTLRGDLKLAIDEAEKQVLIDQLRATEGAGVTICADNADFGGPNAVIEVCADWTNWEVARFPGATVLDCLKAACRAAGIPS